MRLRSVARVAVMGVLAACGSGAFEPSSHIISVRILATIADLPYAQPGDTVTLTTLAVDGRTDKSTPMKLYWLPISCVDPPGDVYYACFAALAGRGMGGGTGPALMPGVDLTPFLPQGDTFQVKIPESIIGAHKAVPGSVGPFGTAFAFNIACAGHIEILPFDPNNISPQAPPIGCFDASHKQLGPDDFVLGFTQLYSFANLPDPRDPSGAGIKVENQNPVITSVTLQSMPVDVALGITFDHCAGNCLENDIDVVVPASSWEVNPGDVDPDGTQHHEVIWVDYYVTDGAMGSDAKLLYDAVKGKLNDPHVTYTPPPNPGDQTMYVVVHDNRGGTAWQVIPLHVR